MKNINKILILFLLFLIPTQSFAIFGMDIVYFHYENSFLADNIKYLTALNDFFEKYFSWNWYLKIIVFLFVLSVLLVAFEVLRGKKPVMVLMDTFVWKDVKNNIVTKFFLVVVVYVIFLAPIPMLSVKPILIQNQTNNELEVYAWTIDIEGSLLESLDSNGNSKLVHVPSIIGVPLKLIEKYIYGFPSFENLKLDKTIEFQRKSFNEGTNTTADNYDYNKITADNTSPCYTLPKDTTVTKTQITNCQNLLDSRGLKVSSFSLIGNSLSYSAETMSNVTAPFIYIKEILKFQENLVSSVMSNDSTMQEISIIDKQFEMLKELNNDSESMKKVFEITSIQYKERYKKILDLLNENLNMAIELNEALGTYSGIGGFLRVFIEELKLSKDTEGNFNQNSGLAPYFSEGHIKNSIDLTPYINSRNTFCQLVNTSVSSTPVPESIKLVSYQENDCLITNDKVNLSDFMEINSSLNIEELNYEGIPFSVNTDGFIVYDINNAKTGKENTTNKTIIINDFFNNLGVFLDQISTFEEQYKTKSFKYFDSKMLYYILKNNGYDSGSITEANIEIFTKFLTKMEIQQNKLFFLDLVIDFLNNKKAELTEFMYSNNGLALTPELYKNPSAILSVPLNKEKVDGYFQKFKADNKMLFGYIFDDYSFKGTNPSGFFLKSIKPDTRLYTLETNGGLVDGGDFYISKNKKYIKKFFCEDTTELNLTGYCVILPSSTSMPSLNKNTIQTIFGYKQVYNNIMDMLGKEINKQEGINKNVTNNQFPTTNPCEYNPTSLECAVFFEQENLLKNTNNAGLLTTAEKNYITNNSTLLLDENNDLFEAISYNYSAYLRYIIAKALEVEATKKSADMLSPVCDNHLIGNPSVFYSYMESYEILKRLLKNAATKHGKNMADAKLYISMLSGLKNNLEKGNIGWFYDGSATSGNPNIQFNSNFVKKITLAMDSATAYSGIFTADRKARLLSLKNEWTNLGSSAPSETKYKDQINILVEYLAHNSEISFTNSDFVEEFINYFIRIVDSLYNSKKITKLQSENLGRLRSFSFNFEYIIGSGLTLSFVNYPNIEEVLNGYTINDNQNENTDLQLLEVSMNQNSQEPNAFTYSKYRTKLVIPEDVCKNTKISSTDNKVDETKKMDNDNETVLEGSNIFSIIFSILIGALTSLAFFVTILVFGHVLFYSVIASIIGWLSVISLAYISVLNILILRNMEEFPLIKQNLKDPSEKLLVYFFKALLASIFVFIYLVALVFIMKGILVPWMENLTLEALVSSIAERNDMELSLTFQFISIVFAVVAFSIMQFSLKIVKDLLIKEIISPSGMAIKKAYDFAKSLQK